jgi:photosystem II stability/assembly factor-like uncharacterized protein
MPVIRVKQVGDKIKDILSKEVTMSHKTLFVNFLAAVFLLVGCTLPATPASPAVTPSSAPVLTLTSLPAPTQVSTLPPVITATNVPVPTQAPTTASTTAPTQVPTTVPTQAPTAVPTTIPGAIPHFAAGSDVTLTQVRIFSKTEGWAVGRNTTLDPNSEHILRTADGGATWQDVTPAQKAGTGAAGSGPALQAEAFFLDGQRAWAGFSPQPGSSIIVSSIWYTTDAGQTWQTSAALSQGSGTPEYFAPGPITFLPDGKTGWLLVHAGQGMNHDYIYIFSTADGGVHWNLKVDPMDINKGSIMSCYKSGLGFVDANSGWLAGSCNGVAAGVLLFNTKDGGGAWNAVSLPAPSQAPNILTAGDFSCGSQPPLFVSAKEGFLAMTCSTFDQAKASQTWIYVTTDGGATWTPRLAPAPKGNFQFINASEGWFVGGGQIFKTGDGGKTWAALTKVTWAGAQPSFIDAKTGWAVAFSGQEPNVQYALVSSANGGATWALIKAKVK